LDREFDASGIDFGCSEDANFDKISEACAENIEKLWHWWYIFQSVENHCVECIFLTDNWANYAEVKILTKYDCDPVAWKVFCSCCCARHISLQRHVVDDVGRVSALE